MEKAFWPSHPTLVAHSGETRPVPVAHEPVLMESTPCPHQPALSSSHTPSSLFPHTKKE